MDGQMSATARPAVTYLKTEPNWRKNINFGVGTAEPRAFPTHPIRQHPSFLRPTWKVYGVLSVDLPPYQPRIYIAHP
ncbi:hypothetical protein CGCS363_v003532 [Colletotrichum siamense]|uniref:uncharacterized protein n=1 Tax=Colletotrichum siamense TaxID=690259 RepID=UPI001872F1D0|nr:uncharacterized protein CGCS363_v003532 [Colletotrichum siamense]KAF5511225.1 hypothetical protein CGCS363_v003532 [Colletotrichum siamense]